MAVMRDDDEFEFDDLPGQAPAAVQPEDLILFPEEEAPSPAAAPKLPETRAMRAAAALGLSPEQRDQLLYVLHQAHLHQDSAGGIDLALAWHLETVAKSLPEEIRKPLAAGLRALTSAIQQAEAGIPAAVDRALDDVLATLETEVLERSRKAIAAAQAAADTNLKAADEHTRAARYAAQQAAAETKAVSAKAVAEVVGQIATEVNAAVVRAAVSRERSSRSRWAIATGCIALAVSLIAGAVGWAGGKATATSTVAAVQTMLTREDGSAWLRLMEANNGATLLSTCRPGAPSLRVTEAGVGCTVTLLLERTAAIGATPGRPLEARVILPAAEDWAVRNLGVWGLLAVGAALAGVFMAAARKGGRRPA